MRSSRRRARKPDPLSSSVAVRAILNQLRERCPDTIPSSDRRLLKMLEAIRHIERRSATDTKRGRPARWDRKQLLEVGSHLRAILQRETSGRISLSSFIGQYLRILSFPADVTTALEHSDINLQEAAQLARLTPAHLDCSAQKAFSIRAEILRTHLAARGSQNALRVRIKEILSEVVDLTTEQMTDVVEKADLLLEIDPSDKRHIFYEQMKLLFYAMRDVQPEDLDDESIDKILAAADQLFSVIGAVEMKRKQREKSIRKFYL